MASSFSPHSLDGVHGGARCTGRRSKYWSQPRRVKHLGRWHRGGREQRGVGSESGRRWAGGLRWDDRSRWSHAHVLENCMTFHGLTRRWICTAVLWGVSRPTRNFWLIIDQSLRNLWLPRRSRRQWKNRICLRTSTLSFLLVVLSHRIHNPSKEPDRYGRHRSEGNWVTEEDHAGRRDWQFIQSANHTDPK